MAEPGQTERIAFLASTEIFRDTAAEALRDLAGDLEIVNLAAGEKLFEQGERGDSMYLIVSGELRVLGTGPGGEQQLLAVHGPGREVGELALWTGARRSATVQASVPTRAARLTRGAFERLKERHPDAVAGIDRHIGQRLRQAQLGSALYLSGIFSGFEESVLRDLEAALETQWIAGGATVFKQGDQGDALYIVVNGLMQVVAEPPGEAPKVVAELGRGELFGEMTLLANEPRSATVRAIRDSQLARLTRADFDNLLARHPRAILPLARKLVTRLRSQTSGSGQSRRKGLTIAVVPASADVPADEFCDRLAKSLAAHGPTLALNAARLDAYLESPGAAQVDASQASHGRLMDLLAKLETDYQYVIYQTDAFESAWTARCLRQCDRVLVAGMAGADPKPGVAELAVERAFSQRTTNGVTLALLHRDGKAMPSGTNHWLDARAVDRHYHIRLDGHGDFDRLARSLAGKAVGLVLGGGAARAFAHAGLIRALREAGVPIDLVGGTSAGGTFAAACALEYDYDRSIHLAYTGIAAMLSNFTIPIVSLISGRDVIPFVRDAVGDLQVEDLWLTFFCVSANITRARIQVHQRGNLGRSLLATGRLPGILPPLLWDGDLLVDGGIIDNVPVDIMRGYPDCGVVIASDVTPAYDPPEISAFGDWISGWHALSQRFKPAASRKKFPSMMSVLMRTVEFGGAAYKSQTMGGVDLYLPMPVAQFKMNDFKRGREIAEAGYQYARPKVEEWLKSASPATVQTTGSVG